MRPIHVCLGCAALYLPPASMTYPSYGLTASPVHCGMTACKSAVTDSLRYLAVPEETVAKWARRAAGVEGAVRRGRPGRLARGRRSVSSPGSGRSKLL